MRDEKEISSQIESNADKLFGKDWLIKLAYSAGYMDGIAYADNHPNWEEIVERMRKEITNDLRNDRWISVKEELPKKDGKYLIYTKSGQQIIANYECYRGKWHQFNEAFFTPTHWAHLPQLPLVTDLNKKDLPPVSWQEGNILVEEEGGEK